MSPKQQVEELVNKFKHEAYNNLPQLQSEMFKLCIQKLAIQCTLICVKYIISANPHSNPLNTEPVSTMDYWLEAKNENENYNPS